MSATLRSVDLDERSAPHFLKKILEPQRDAPRAPRETPAAPKSENVFQLLERALQTLEFLHQRCAELNEELDSSKKRLKELEEKKAEWQRIAQASLEQAKHSERLRIDLQAQLDEQAKKAEKNSSAEADEYLNMQERIWSMFCAHSKSYAILKEIAEVSGAPDLSGSNVTELRAVEADRTMQSAAEHFGIQ